ncbi:MAG TPA: sialate O-acetylesterase [Bryobacteraceae bacterium]|nr:sialate O-acetylesterase [Bryobacteraceae bacterium]
MNDRNRYLLSRRKLLAAAPLFASIALGANDLEISLGSPIDYQVFQRDQRQSGNIVVSGRAGIACDAVEACVVVPQAKNTWAPVAFDSFARTFRDEIPAPAGGFYEVEVRLLRAGKPVAQAIVPHVGVGEVFVIAGQSNATNYGEVPQETQTDMVVSFSGSSWVIANDPQPGVQDNSHKGSFIPAFGDAMYRKYHVPIGVACVGYGGTSVRQWLPEGDQFSTPPTTSKFVRQTNSGAWTSDGTLFNGMMKRIDKLGHHGFRALLWHQGESDAHQAPGDQITGDEYFALMKTLILASWQEALWQFPWFVAEASYHNPSDRSSPEIRAAQRRLWRSGLALPGPDTDQLGPAYRQNNGKGVHFNAEGLQAHGRLWAKAVEPWLDGVLG